jgi:small subunit ribosomal protein S2
MASISIPEVKDILATGLQFGHSTSRWNPQMAKYIFGEKNGIHIIDVMQTRDALEKAANFLVDAAGRGEIVFVGTKRQSAELVKQEAMRVGAHFVVNRWAGGLFTNFAMVNRSLMRLAELEKMFEEGVEGRTKYEISKLKVEWEKLNRLYAGIKSMSKLPAAIVVIDPRYEKAAVREARKVHVPVVGLVDSNCDPKLVDYLIPGNDDALKAIELVLKVLGDAVLEGNKGNGVKHDLRDYKDVEVKIIRTEVKEEGDREELAVEEGAAQNTEAAATATKAKPAKSTRSGSSKGILEMAKEKAANEAKSEIKDQKSEVKEKNVKPAKAAKPAAKKAAAKKPAKSKK